MKLLPKPFRLADQTILALNRKTVRRLTQTKAALNKLGFDELSVLKETDSLYAALDEDCRTAFKELWKQRYIEVSEALEHPVPDEDMLDELIEMAIAGLLGEPNPVTMYVYETEVYRKRDRAKESILAVDGRSAKDAELDKAMRIWARSSIGWYTDLTANDAALTAMKDADVRYVFWNSEYDTRVCAVCSELDGRKFPIDDVPPEPHPGCRCWLTPAD